MKSASIYESELKRFIRNIYEPGEAVHFFVLVLQLKVADKLKNKSEKQREYADERTHIVLRWFYALCLRRGLLLLFYLRHGRGAPY